MNIYFIINNMDCIICQEDEKKELYNLSCDHSYHKDCIFVWFKGLKKNNKIATCPLCRMNCDKDYKEDFKHNKITILEVITVLSLKKTEDEKERLLQMTNKQRKQEIQIKKMEKIWKKEHERRKKYSSNKIRKKKTRKQRLAERNKRFQ